MANPDKNFDADAFQKQVLEAIDSTQETMRVIDKSLQEASFLFGKASSSYMNEDSIQFRTDIPSPLQSSARIVVKNPLFVEREKLYKELLHENSLFAIGRKGRIERIINRLKEIDNQIGELLASEVTTFVQQRLAIHGEERSRLNQELLQQLLQIEETKQQKETQIITEASKLFIVYDLRRVLCPALKSMSSDAHDIAKIITPIIVPLVLAGALSIPLQPFVFAYLAIFISRMGIATLCNDDKKKEEQTED